MKNIATPLFRKENSWFRAILLCGAIVVTAALPSRVNATDTLPSWSITSHNGKSIHSNSLGKVTVVNFWATYCLPCMVEMPTLQNLSQKYAKNGLTVLGVAVDANSQSMLQAFAEKFKLSYSMALGNPQIMSGFGVNDTVPMTFILDQQGRVFRKHVGYVKKEVLESDIRAALKL